MNWCFLPFILKRIKLSSPRQLCYNISIAPLEVRMDRLALAARISCLRESHTTTTSNWQDSPTLEMRQLTSPPRDLYSPHEQWSHEIKHFTSIIIFIQQDMVSKILSINYIYTASVIFLGNVLSVEETQNMSALTCSRCALGSISWDVMILEISTNKRWGKNVERIEAKKARRLLGTLSNLLSALSDLVV